jgi:hypothetical protein
MNVVDGAGMRWALAALVAAIRMSSANVTAFTGTPMRTLR